MGVWTIPDMDGTKTVYYPKEITKYYDEHKDSGFFNEDMIICGDFNCDVRLKGAHAKNVYEVIEKLSECGFTDTYHYLNNEKQGEESQSTFFMYRHLDKPFHLDHVFAKKGRIDDLQIGDNLNLKINPNLSNSSYRKILFKHQNIEEIWFYHIYHSNIWFLDILEPFSDLNNINSSPINLLVNEIYFDVLKNIFDSYGFNDLSGLSEGMKRLGKYSEKQFSFKYYNGVIMILNPK